MDPVSQESSRPSDTREFSDTSTLVCLLEEMPNGMTGVYLFFGNVVGFVADSGYIGSYFLLF